MMWYYFFSLRDFRAKVLQIFGIYKDLNKKRQIYLNF